MHINVYVYTQTVHTCMCICIHMCTQICSYMFFRGCSFLQVDLDAHQFEPLIPKALTGQTSQSWRQCLRGHRVALSVFEGTSSSSFKSWGKSWLAFGPIATLGPSGPSVCMLRVVSCVLRVAARVTRPAAKKDPQITPTTVSLAANGCCHSFELLGCGWGYSPGLCLGAFAWVLKAEPLAITESQCQPLVQKREAAAICSQQ